MARRLLSTRTTYALWILLVLTSIHLVVLQDCEEVFIQVTNDGYVNINDSVTVLCEAPSCPHPPLQVIVNCDHLDSDEYYEVIDHGNNYFSIKYTFPATPADGTNITCGLVSSPFVLESSTITIHLLNGYVTILLTTKLLMHTLVNTETASPQTSSSSTSSTQGDSFDKIKIIAFIIVIIIIIIIITISILFAWFYYKKCCKSERAEGEEILLQVMPPTVQECQEEKAENGEEDKKEPRRKKGDEEEAKGEKLDERKTEEEVEGEEEPRSILQTKRELCPSMIASPPPLPDASDPEESVTAYSGTRLTEPEKPSSHAPKVGTQMLGSSSLPPLLQQTFPPPPPISSPPPSQTKPPPAKKIGGQFGDEDDDDDRFTASMNEPLPKTSSQSKILSSTETGKQSNVPGDISSSELDLTEEHISSVSPPTASLATVSPYDLE